MSKKLQISQIALQIEAAFELRWLRRLEECQIAFSQLKVLASNSAQFSTRDKLDLICLELSLANAAGETERALELTLEAESLKQADSFYYALTKAIGATSKGQWNTALQGYLHALVIATSASQRTVALFNSMVCLENMGMPFAQSQEKFLTELKQLKSGQFKDFFEDQFLLFQSRGLFHHGKFRELILSHDSRKMSHIGQETYLRAWVAQLPYHTLQATHASALLESVLTSKVQMYQSEYRVRTLQGRVTPSDLDGQAFNSDAADRFYLLVWSWLKDPQVITLEKALKTFQKLGLPAQRVRFTQEDLQLIRNALLWLTLMSPDSQDNFKATLEAISVPSHVESPLFKFEKEVILLLQSYKDGANWLVEDALKSLEESPLWHNPDFLLPKLVRDLITGQQGSGGLSRLLNGLRAITIDSSPVLKQNKAQKIEVNLRLFQVIAQGRRQHSEALALALELLNRKPVVSIEEFAAHCFGIKNFDSTVHLSKVFNLVSRLKALAPQESQPQIRVGIKNGKVWSELNPDSFAWIRGDVFSAGMQSASRILKKRDVKSLSPQALAKRTSVVAARKAVGQFLSRSQLEALLNRPRSTVNRLINDWVKNGQLNKSGQGRNTVYQVVTEEIFK